MKIALGTTSDLKIRAVESACLQLKIDTEIKPVKARSGVPDQPFGYREITKGATNRAKEALKKTSADMAIGIENGCVYIKELGEWYDIPGVCVITKDGKESFGFGAAHSVPTWMINKVKQDKTDLGVLIQELETGSEKDLVNYFSGGKIKREKFLADAVACALFGIINQHNNKEPDGY